MTTFKNLEDNLRSFMLQEQSDAHNIRSVSVAKYNNLKIWMDISKYQQAHFFVRISISEAVFSASDCAKLNGGLGYEERFIYKWFGRVGIKDKINELWSNALMERDTEAESDENQEK